MYPQGPIETLALRAAAAYLHVLSDPIAAIIMSRAVLQQQVSVQSSWNKLKFKAILYQPYGALVDCSAMQCIHITACPISRICTDVLYRCGLTLGCVFMFFSSDWVRWWKHLEFPGGSCGKQRSLVAWLEHCTCGALSLRKPWTLSWLSLVSFDLHTVRWGSSKQAGTCLCLLFVGHSVNVMDTI